VLARTPAPALELAAEPRAIVRSIGETPRIGARRRILDRGLPGARELAVAFAAGQAIKAVGIVEFEDSNLAQLAGEFVDLFAASALVRSPELLVCGLLREFADLRHFRVIGSTSAPTKQGRERAHHQ